ncbi:cytochrome c peroxidase [Rhodotorula sphaerocarpa]
MGAIETQKDAAKSSHKPDYDAVRKASPAAPPPNWPRIPPPNIASIIKMPDYDDGSCGPVLVRLAWHASGTYDAETNTGGSNGAGMRYEAEGGDPANAGLEHARRFLEPIKQKHPWITYADLWTLAGVVAIKEMGGPDIKWKPGRTDFADESKCPPRGRLPDGAQAADHLRHIFYRMGFNDQEIVALAGAHSLGRCHSDRSGFEGPWSVTPTKFSTQYYKREMLLGLLRGGWETDFFASTITPRLLPLTHVQLTKFKWEKKTWEGPVQFKNTDLGEELMMLPTDMALIEDEKFLPYVKKYAEDREAFYHDFAEVFAKLIELGVTRDEQYESAPPFSKEEGDRKEAEAKSKI